MSSEYVLKPFFSLWVGLGVGSVYLRVTQIQPCSYPPSCCSMAILLPPPFSSPSLNIAYFLLFVSVWGTALLPICVRNGICIAFCWQQEWSCVDMGLWVWIGAVLSLFSCVRLFETLWTVACQAPLSMGFCRQEYWSGLPSPPPGNFPTEGYKSASPAAPALQADGLLLNH